MIGVTFCCYELRSYRPIKTKYDYICAPAKIGGGVFIETTAKTAYTAQENGADGDENRNAAQG